MAEAWLAYLRRANIFRNPKMLLKWRFYSLEGWVQSKKPLADADIFGGFLILLLN